METNLLTPEDEKIRKKLLEKQFHKDLRKQSIKFKKFADELNDWGRNFRKFQMLIEHQYFGTYGEPYGWCIYNREKENKSCKNCGTELPLQKTFSVHMQEGCKGK